MILILKALFFTLAVIGFGVGFLYLLVTFPYEFLLTVIVFVAIFICVSLFLGIYNALKANRRA